MTHCDAVVDGNRVELLGDAAGCLDFTGNQLTEILEVHMSRYELRERVHDRDDRLAEVGFLHTGGTPKGAGARHIPAVRGGAGAVHGHGETSGCKA